MKILTAFIMCVLAGAEVDLFIPSFPELQKQFNLTPFMVQFTMSINFCAYCFSSFLAGTLGDRYGRRNTILWGLLIFCLGSALCSFANSFPLILIGRLLQGIGVAGPAVLAYVVIADDYPIDTQHKIMGYLNGTITLAMGGAPLVGSYINLYYGWRGNFICLLIIGMISLILALLYVPNKPGNKEVKLSLGSYIELIKSNQFVFYIISICFAIIPYWSFVAMAPILYMSDLGVSLKHFGYYQGVLAVGFALISLMSSILIKHFGKRKCFLFSSILWSIGGLCYFIVALAGIKNPLIITAAFLPCSLGVVIPLNILYPLALDIVENSKGRAAAMILSVRLILTSATIQIVSYVYDNSFYYIAIAMFICQIIAMLATIIMLKKNWIPLES